MFKSFFLSRHFALWGWPGAALIFLGTWYQVQIDVAINEWFGGFYDLVQKALSAPGAITLGEFFWIPAELWQARWYLCIGRCIPEFLF